MKRKTIYTTKQGEAVLEYIASLDGVHATVEQIAEYFENQNAGIGLTTIYRNLDKLVKSGKVRKYIIDGVSSACYQYVSEPNQEHFHLKCESCGALKHLECETLESIFKHIFRNHDFEINQTKTVLYGKCKNCVSNSLNL